MTDKQELRRERRRGMLIMLLIIIALTLGGCDITIAGVTVWRSPAGWIADALHEWHGGEPHPGRRE